jgi:hypothetical protein
LDFKKNSSVGEFSPGKKKGWREEPSIFIICMGIQRERERKIVEEELWSLCREFFS